MRSGAAAGHRGYFHEAAFYGSDEEFLALVLPFLRGGTAAGEPTLVALDEATTALVRAALPDTAGITFLPATDRYARPAAAIRSYRELLAGFDAEGAGQVRIVGEVPHPGSGADWHRWARYEAAVNHALSEFPVWGMCPYDTRTAPPEVLADVLATHPRIATAGGKHLVNDGFTDPVGFLVRSQAERSLPDTGPPDLDLRDPTPAAARRAVRALAAPLLDLDEVDDLVLAVSEAVNNAHTHGAPPVRLRVWSDSGRVAAAVTDAGTGPADPYAGLLPTVGSATAGLGLWMAHQICSDVTFHRDADGFTVRVVADRSRAHAAVPWFPAAPAGTAEPEPESRSA